MPAHPELALDLPFWVLISQQAETLVSYHPAETLQHYGLDATVIQTLKRLGQFVEKVSTKAEKPISIGRCVCTGDVANFLPITLCQRLCSCLGASIFCRLNFGWVNQ